MVKRRAAAVLTVVLMIAAMCAHVLPGTSGASAADQAAQPGRRALADSGVNPSPTVADIDGDGMDEIIIGDGGSTLKCLNHDGSLRWAVDTGARVSSSAAAWDVNGNGRMEIFVGNRAGWVFGFDADGRLLSEWGWPKPTHINPERPAREVGVFSSPAIDDITGDGNMEIVVGSWSHRIWAWHYHGPVVAGFPVDVKDTIWSSPAIGDINRDGRNEIVIGTDCTAGPGWPYPSGGLVFVIDGAGRNLPGWPKSTPQVIWSSPALADLNGDGYLNIIVGTGHYFQNVHGNLLYAWDHHGNNLPGWPAATAAYVFSSPAVGDITGDGRLEVAVGDIGGNQYVFSADGRQISHHQWVYPLGSPVIGDIDGDGRPDVLYDERSAPAVGDFNKDGKVDIATFHGVTRTDAPYDPDKFPWPMFRHDSRHTGCFGSTGPLPPPKITSYETYVLLQNPNPRAAEVNLTYMMKDGETEEGSLVLQPNSRRTVFLNDAVGFGKEVSTMVSSDLPVIAERAVYFNAGGRQGGSCSAGTPEASTEWYLAEGYTGPGFDTWILVQNPNERPAAVTLHLAGEDGVERPLSFEMPPGSRRSVHLNTVGGFESRDVSTRVTSSIPVVAERAMYFDYRGAHGGHGSMGVPAPAAEWFMSEGCTGWGFDTYILVQNPQEEPARVRFTFMKDDGGKVEYSRVVGPGSRFTIDVGGLEGMGHCNFSTVIAGDRPVVAERSMYFNSGGRIGGHNSSGVTSASETWYLAEGYTAGGFETWISVQNPNDEAAVIDATFMKPGGVTVERRLEVGPESRFTLPVGSVPGLDATEVSTRLESVNGVTFVAERSMYFMHRGVWSGGHNSAGVVSPSVRWYFAEGYTG